jgi:hypothetical protein
MIRIGSYLRVVRRRRRLPAQQRGAEREAAEHDAQDGRGGVNPATQQAIGEPVPKRATPPRACD